MPTTKTTVTVRIPTPLRSATDGQSTVNVEADTVGDALRTLTDQYPDLADNLYNEDDELRQFVNIYVGDDDIRFGDGVDTALDTGDEVSIVPSIAGGVRAPVFGVWCSGTPFCGPPVAITLALPPPNPHPVNNQPIPMKATASRTDDATLSPDELQRYSRHLTLPEFGREGQETLKNASVLLVGAGGLGSPAATYLAAAGVGRIGLVDFDAVEASNLQRQILYGTSDVGRPKLDAASERLEDLNPHVNVETHEVRLTSDNALDIIDDYDVVADGTDNFRPATSSTMPA